MYECEKLLVIRTGEKKSINLERNSIISSENTSASPRSFQDSKGQGMECLGFPLDWDGVGGNQ